MPGKNSSSGPEAAVTEQNLLSLLPQEVAAYESQTPQTQQVTRDALSAGLDTWGKVYHALVWLAAAKDPPNSNTLIFLNEDTTPIILHNSHIVPAFNGSEGGSSSTELGGLVFALKAVFDQDKDDDTGGIFFKDEAYQEYIIDGTQQPLLQHFLDKFRTRRTTLGFDLPTFDPAQVINNCKNSATQANFHNKTGQFAGKGLDLIQAFWGGSIAADLQTVINWVDGDPAAGSSPWLDTELGINALNVFGLFAGNDTAAKHKLNNAMLAFALNREIYGFIYDRFVDLDDGSLKSDGLEQVIAILISPPAAQNQQGEWDKLITATYGVVALKIFDQTSKLVDEAKPLLP